MLSKQLILAKEIVKSIDIYDVQKQMADSILISKF